MCCIGIVGATGIVGQELLAVLSEGKLTVGEVRLTASPSSTGKIINTPWGLRPVWPLNESFFVDLDLCFFCAGSAISKQWIPRAIACGAVCIDNSSAYRMEPDVPIVIPEVNGVLLKQKPRLIANPNCSAAQLTVALNPLCQEFGLAEVIVSTYQSVSGAGYKALQQLLSETTDFTQGEHDKNQFLFNIIPWIGESDSTGHYTEEIKIIHETRKILERYDLSIAVTAARVPVPRCHCQSVSFVTEKPATVVDIVQVLSQAPNVIVIEDCEQNSRLLPASCIRNNKVHVGRIRANNFHGTRSFSMWVTADNLRKGAAHNALSIAETWCGLNE